MHPQATFHGCSLPISKLPFLPYRLLPAFSTIKKEITAPLLKEGWIEVGAVDCDVAQRASLKEAGLVMKRRSSRRPAEAGRRMALQAEQVDVAELQHVRIRSAMHQVA